MKNLPQPDWDPQSAVAFWLNQTSRAVMRLHESRLRPLGLSMGQIHVLMGMEEQGSMSQKALVAWAQVEQPTMAEMLGRMERDGFVKREPDPDDKRSTRVSLTRKGRSRLAEARAALTENEEKVTHGFSTAEKALLKRMLARVMGNVAAASQET